jgi:ferredoxin-NADP reductase
MTTQYITEQLGETRTLEVREAEFDLVVVDRQEVAEDVVVLTLRQDNHRLLPAWQPGSHIDLLLDGIGPRQYSLCGDPADRRHWRIGVLREPAGRGGSQHIHESLQIDSAVRARGPRNHFHLGPSHRYLFIAGGIGVTPILPMVREAQAAGADWRLVYGGRQLASMAFVDELRGIDCDRVTLWPQDENGLIDLASLLTPARPGTQVYCCGPEPLLNAVEAGCSAWPEGSLRIERFVAKQVEEPARCRRSDPSCRWWRKPAYTSCPHAARAPAVPATPRFSRANRTIATPC